MSFTEIGQEGALNGTTPVTIVSVPSSGQRKLVNKINIHNRDTASVTVTVSKNKNATLRRLIRVTLEPDDTLIYDSIIVLDATDESVEAVLSGAPSTSNPDYDTSAGLAAD